MTEATFLRLGDARPLAIKLNLSGHRRSKMKLIKLNMADGIEHVEAAGEDDGPTLITQERYKPVAIVLDQIRNFYPRKGDRIGTRIMLRNGSAIPVKETMEEVEAAISAAQS